MPQVSKFDMSGKEIGDFELNDKVFAEDVNEHVVHQVVTAQLAAIRRGTASTKTRSEVRGGGRKPWRQKGTGRARHGTIRSPLWVGGGVTFGPKPRSYKKKVNKKMKRLALRSILTDKVNNDQLKIIDELDYDKPKTKQVVNLIKDFDLEDKKVLIVLPEKNENVYLSARNLPNIDTMVLDAMNAYQLLDNDYILVPEEAAQKIEEVLAE
ncbi:MAG TPA: 50S ribosomal protein L4 [Halanaerobiales bacterium]|nr:50S ribosomal protein L4 [Halanaerobiales bacterium]